MKFLLLSSRIISLRLWTNYASGKYGAAVIVSVLDLINTSFSTSSSVSTNYS